MKLKIAVGCLIVGLLPGCTGSTNPAEAGLFDNVSNLQSGEYDRQIAAKEAEAMAITQANAAIRADSTSKQASSTSNAALIVSLKEEIASLRAEAASMRGKVSGEPERIAQLDSLDGQISAVQADLNAGGDPSVLSAEMRRLRTAIRALAN